VVIVFGERRKKKKKKRKKKLPPYHSSILNKSKKQKNGTKNVDGVIVRGSRELDIRQKKKKPEYSKPSEDDVTVKDLSWNSKSKTIEGETVNSKTSEDVT